MSTFPSSSADAALPTDLSNSPASQKQTERSRGGRPYVAPEPSAPSRNAWNVPGIDDDRKASSSTGITNLKLSSLPMVDFEVVPYMLMADSRWLDLQVYQWEWFVEIPEDQRWMKVSDGPTFSPSTQDAGRKIKVRCVPRDPQEGGGPREVITDHAVTVGPKHGGISQRHETTTFPLQSRDQFRIITYNILFDGYLRRDALIDYKYCAPYVMEESFRQQLVVKEVKRYHGDILCFQEVGLNVYTNYLQPALTAAGYEGVFSSRVGESFREGLAMFYRTDKIQLKRASTIVIKDVLINDSSFSVLCDILQKQFPDVFQLVCSLYHMCQAAIFSNGTTSFMVLNTHLYWVVENELTRLVQVYVIFQCVERMRKELGLGDAGIIFAGDLNHQPDSDTYRYINEGKIQLEGGGKNPIQLNHTLGLTNATGTPLYSWLVDHTQHLLDYVYVNNNFCVLQSIPLPSEEELEQDGKFVLPSSRFGSDHLAMGVDVELVNIGHTVDCTSK